MLQYFPCNPAAVDPSNPEICDGINNTSGGPVEDSVKSVCSFPTGLFSSCFGCPTDIPNFKFEMVAGSGRTMIPDAGCPDLQTWDPIKAVCTPMKRPAADLSAINKQSRFGQGGATFGNGDQGNGIRSNSNPGETSRTNPTSKKPENVGSEANILSNFSILMGISLAIFGGIVQFFV